MSQVTYSGANDPRRINRAPETPQTGIQGSLDSPGLVVPPPVSSSAQNFRELQQALGQLGSTADSVNSYNRQVAADKRREDEAARVFDEGHAATAYRQDLAGAEQDITNRKLTAPDGVSNAEFAQQWINARTKGQSEAFSSFYADHALLPLTGLLNAQSAQIKKESQNSLGENVTSLVSVATSNEEVAAAIGKAREAPAFSTMPETEFYGKYVLPALNNAAESGDQERFDIINEELKTDDGNPMFAPEQSRAAITLRGAQNRNKVDNQQFFDNADAANALSGATFDNRRDMTKQAVQGGLIDPDYGFNHLRKIDSEEQTYNTQTAAGQVRLLRQKYRQNDQNATINHLLDYQTTGGAATVADTRKPLPNGEEFVNDNKAKTRDAIDSIFAQLDRNKPDPTAPTPELQNLPDKLAILRRTGAPYEPITNLLNGGANQASVQSIASLAKDGKTPQIDAALQKGLDTWERLAVDPKLRSRLTTDKDAQIFYETVDLAKTYATQGDTAKAMLMASQALSDRDAFSERLTDRIPLQDLARAVKNVSTKTDDPWIPSLLGGSSALGDFKNGNMVSRDVENLTRFAMSRALNLPPDKALEWASDNVRHSIISVNGWAVNAADRHVPPDIQTLGTDIATGYVTANPKEGVSGDDLTLRPLTANSWVLVNGHTNIPVDNWQSQGVFTDSELFNRSVQKNIAATVHPAKGEPKPYNYQDAYQHGGAYSGPANDYGGVRP